MPRETKPPTSARTVRLTDELWEELSERASAKGMKLNALVAALLHAGLRGVPAYIVAEGPAPYTQHRDDARNEQSASARAEELAQRRAAEEERMRGWFAPKGKR